MAGGRGVLRAALCAIALLGWTVDDSLSLPYQRTPRRQIEVGFSPDQGATERIVRFIGEAKTTIRGAAYSFTSAPIAKALLEAHRRGVDVRMVLDKSQQSARYSSYTFLKNAGVPVRTNARHAIMHNKYLIVDSRNVQLGSFNYTRAAESKNAENLLILRNAPKVGKRYTADWEKLWNEGE